MAHLFTLALLAAQAASPPPAAPSPTVVAPTTDTTPTPAPPPATPPPPSASPTATPPTPSASTPLPPAPPLPTPPATPAPAPASDRDKKEDRKEDKPPSFALPRDEEERLANSPTDSKNMRFVPGKGLEVKSKDGRFALAMSLRFGFLYSLRHDGESGAIDNNVEIRRFRTVFFGNLFGAHNKYFLQLALAPRELDLRDGVVHGSPVYDAYMQFERFKNLNLRIGQYRVMYTRERNIADVNPLLIDRSLVNGEFNVDRDIGFDLRSEDLGGVKKLRYYAGAFLGEGRDHNKFTDPGFMYVARVDVLPFGSFDDYEASDLWRYKKFRASISGAYAFIDRAKKDKGVLGTAFEDAGTANYHNATADLMIKYAGWSLESAYMWRRGTRTPGNAVDEMMVPYPVTAARNGHGWLIQTAFLIPKIRLEPAFRYSGSRGLGTVTSLPDRDEIGGGLNYYFFGHNLKLQLDYFRTFNSGQLALGTDLLRIQIQAAL